MVPAIFLDRDGVIIENREHYVRSWADVALYPGAIKALSLINDIPLKIVIITNQSAVGRGIISVEEAEDINNRLLAVIEQSGGRIDAVFMCTHAPQQGCDCRKPRPGLILQAASELNLDLQRSFLIGDALSDIEAGKNAGITRNILVRTGRGEKQSHLPAATLIEPFQIFDRFEDAVEFLMPDFLSAGNR